MARFFIDNIFYLTGVGSVLSGKVVDDNIRVGMKTNLDQNIFELQSIKKNNQSLNEAKTGENIAINIKLVQGNLKEGFFSKIFSNKEKSILNSYLKKEIEFN